MYFYKATKNVLTQLKESLQELSNEEYTQPSSRLFNATVGQHVRHIIELFVCLEKGYKTGFLNYEKRRRDPHIETNREFAIDFLTGICRSIKKPDKILVMEANYDEHSEETIMIETNYYRELLYNLEHTVHHMALIRVGINEVSSLEVPNQFGVASSTIKYQRQACAQ